MVFYETKLESICTVIDKNNLVKILTYKVYHLLFSVGELQIMVAFIPVISFIQRIIINACRVGGAVLIGTVDDCVHISRKVSTFAAGTGDNDHSRVGECLCIGDEFICICGNVRLRKCPVLCPHSDYRTVSLILCVERRQFGVRLNACIRKACENVGCRIRIIQRT